MRVKIYLRDGTSVFVSDVDGGRITDALARGQQSVEVRELGGNRTTLNVSNIVRTEVHT
jgi:hypothetical protein